MSKPLNRDQLQHLNKSERIDLVETLFARIEQLEQQVTQQALTIKRLTDQLAKNSTNSSLPPSGDRVKIPRRRSLRTKNGRKPGGQKGHTGQTLQMSDSPDERVYHDLVRCPNCHGDLSHVDSSSQKRRQVFEIPPLQLQVTEHVGQVKPCPHCQQTVCAAFPPQVTQPVQYGPRLLACASYLNTYHLIPMARTTELLGDLFGHRPADAIVGVANGAVEVGSQASLETIHSQLKAASVVRFDESGIRVNGKTQWVHVASTQQLTYYHIHPKRGQLAMNEIGILPHFTGRAVHDHFSSYQTFDNCQHAYCNAHHLRELQFITDQYQQKWAQQMSQLLLEIKAEVDQTTGEVESLPAERLAHFSTCYEPIIQSGHAQNPPPTVPLPKRRGRAKQSPPKNLLDRLDKHREGVLAFIYDFGVPFDNNLAERDIRMIKLKQKISGGFRTPAGAKTFCAIRSYISTVRKFGNNVIDAIVAAVRGKPFIPPVPNTLPE